MAHKVCDTLNQLHTHGNIRLECTNNDKFKSVGNYSLSAATANQCRITNNIRQHKECSCIPAHLHTAYEHRCTPTCINIAVHTCAAHQNICKVRQPKHSRLHTVMHTHTLPKVCSHTHAITHALTCKHPHQAMVLRNSGNPFPTECMSMVQQCHIISVCPRQLTIHQHAHSSQIQSNSMTILMSTCPS